MPLHECIFGGLVLLEEQAKLLASVLMSFFIAFLFFRLVLF